MDGKEKIKRNFNTLSGTIRIKRTKISELIILELADFYLFFYY